jgi:hypothetical protein
MLANSSALAPGTVVAVVVVEGPEAVARWPLRAGIDTGEWAARRDDLPAAAGTARPWSTWVAAPGNHFGQRYRASWEPSAPLPGATALRVERAAGLPAEVSLSFTRLEVRR